MRDCAKEGSHEITKESSGSIKSLNQTWNMDFVTDILDYKRRFRAFTIIDDYNREALHVEVDFSLPSNRVVWFLNHLINHSEKPKKIRMDNGPEFVAKLASEWSQMHDVDFHYIQPGKPTQNAYIGRFNWKYKRGLLDKYIFEDLDQVRPQTQTWMEDYNTQKPHDALGKMAPLEFSALTFLRGTAKRGKSMILDK